MIAHAQQLRKFHFVRVILNVVTINAFKRKFCTLKIMAGDRELEMIVVLKGEVSELPEVEITARLLDEAVRGSMVEGALSPGTRNACGP